MVLGSIYKLQDAHFIYLIIDNHDVKHVSQQKIMVLHIDVKLSLQAISINYALQFHGKYHFYGNCQQM